MRPTLISEIARPAGSSGRAHASRALLALLLATLSCRDMPTAAPPALEPEPAVGNVVGVVEMRVSVVGPGAVNASATVHEPGNLSLDGPQFALTEVPAQGNAHGPILEMLPGAGSFTHGAPGAGGYRYVFASAKVRNAGVNRSVTPPDTVAFTTPRRNLTMIAIEVPARSGFTGIPGTPFTNLRKFDGAAANPAIAEGIIPTGAVRQTLTGGITTHSPDAMQVFTEAEAAAASNFHSAFPYGFIIQHRTDPSTRTLAANPAANQYDGIISLGLKIPLQANPKDDVYGFSMFFVLREDSETRITQSIEEQDAAGQAAFEARVAALATGPGGLSGVTLLPGGSYNGTVAVPVRRLCGVRIAGTVGSPTNTFGGGASGTCPSLTTVSPNVGLRGTTVGVTLTGTNFVSGATTVAVSGSGVSVNSVTVSSATSLTANFVIDAGAAPGARTVTVTTAGGTSSRTFTVTLPPPTFTGISPTSGSQGRTVGVRLTGTNFVPGGTTIVIDGTGVSAVGINVTSSTELIAGFAIEAAAPLGPRNVRITTAGGTSSARTFTVDPPPPPPTLTGISPTSGSQGSTVPVTLTGTNFVSGATVAVSGAGVTVSGVTVVSATSIRANFVIGSGATLGDRNVTLTTAGGTSGALTYTVNPPPPAPTLTSISPTSGNRATTVVVTLTGTNYSAGATVAISGSGVAVHSVTVVSGTSITASFSINGTATLGPRNVTVTTSGGTSGAQTFTVSQPSGSQTFNYTNSTQTFVVPAGVTSIAVEAAGAQAGGGFGSGLAGANGGTVTATIAVTPGESLRIFVGGAGETGHHFAGGAGGFNGGATGGGNGYPGGGGGGGASDVRRASYALADRLVVAGGGGGSGANNLGEAAAGGAGGGTTGATGAAGATGSGGGSGGGGTPTAGGTAGATGGGGGTAGSGGVGGSAGFGNGGGGGGGGYFGGGGGGGGGAGGGGGGGSSFATGGATGVSHTQGNRAGHGRIVITW